MTIWSLLENVPDAGNGERENIEMKTDSNRAVACIRFVRRCGWKLHRWATIRCGNSSERMLGFWCWVLDRLEALFGEPPENAAFHALVDAWCEMDHDEDDDDAPNDRSVALPPELP